MSVSTDSTSLSSLARSKLSLSISKDVSLHRWVLLKNSILHSPSLPNSPAAAAPTPLSPAYRREDSEEEDEQEEVMGASVVESDAFMFPDAGHLLVVDNYLDAETRSSEAQWLDSLLETLGDDDDDYDFRPSPHHHHSEDDHLSEALPVDDDEFPVYSPMLSPMSSSDDLPSQPNYYPSIVPYPVPYPPLHAYHHHHHHHHHFDSSFLSSHSAPYDIPLPYHDLEDLEDLPVPDAIEDTSDDESDAPTTPSLGRSSSSLSFDPASIPVVVPSDLQASSSPISLPERSRLRNATPRVYVDSNDSYFYSFQVDPLPFPDDEHLDTAYNGYQAC